MAQQGYGPPSLPVSTEVSAKYRGAFCEATVKAVMKIVKCKVQLKDASTSIFVTDDEIIKGPVKVGAVVELKHPDTDQPVEAVIHKLIDHSLYTVVFDDGDERTLRRTQLCLKGDKHFIESETLDNLPLSHPEHFGTPVLQNKKGKRKNDEEEEEEENDSEEESPRRAMYRGRHQDLVGKIFLVDLPQRKGSAIPALVVLPDSNSIGEVKRSEQILVRSFKDSKYTTVTRKNLKEFSRVMAIKNEDKTMRIAFEKALLYFDTKELPVGWKKDEMLGSDVEEDEVLEDNEYASEDEPYEEKDRFVAQLYKFMDDRGTPINKGPYIGNKDLNLYKLFKIVENCGGYNKVTKEMKWPVVYSKMGLPSLHQNPAYQIKSAYKKYLDAYETFYRKLGSTMGTLSRPGRARQNSGRSILNFRSREKSPRLPKPAVEKKEEPEAPKPKVEVAEKLEDNQDLGSTASTEESDLLPRRTMQRRDRSQVAKEREESKDKEKKEEAAKGKDKKEDVVKAKKEEVPTTSGKAVKKDEISTPVNKGKREEIASKAKKEDVSVKKEERKSVRKLVKAEEEKEEKDDKKPVRVIKKDKEETIAPDSPKKRLTRRKLLQNDPLKKVDLKDETLEEKKEPVRKVIPKDLRPAGVDKKEKEIPRTLERRDSKTAEKKVVNVKGTDSKPVSEKKTVMKTAEDKKPSNSKREKKGKDDEMSEGEDAEDSDESQKQDRPVSPKIEYPLGSKLRVKYGKGKNQKIYIAKVVDFGTEGPHRTYLVHYAGWNIRYDEWIRGERVASVLDKPGVDKPAVDKPADAAKSVEVAKPVLMVHKPLSSSIKRIDNHRAPALNKKPGQLFRTPKQLLNNAKTRATRSSSSDTSGSSPTVSSEKRKTRRTSIVIEPEEEKSEENQKEESEETPSAEEVNQVPTKDECEEESQVVDIEEEEQEDASTEKQEVDTSMEEDCEEVEVPEEKENVKSEECEDVKEDVKEEPVEELELKTESKEESETVEAEVKLEEEEEEDDQEEVEEKEQQEDSAEDFGDQKPDESNEPLASHSKTERACVMVAEVISADDEITSALSDVEAKEEDVKQEEPTSCETPCLTVENEESDQQDSGKIPLEELDDQKPIDNELKDEDEMDNNEETEKHQSPDVEDESISDQSIPLLKKMDLDADLKDLDKLKAGKSRKKDTGKDAKKPGKDTSLISTEIPTLEPIIMPSEPAPKSSPSPYDFDEAEHDSKWQPEISKKREPVVTEQIPLSKEGTPVSGDVMDKEKKKVKKKTKKKAISPEFVSESKSEGASNSSLLVESASNAAESSTNEEEKSSDKQGQKKKGRKRKDQSVEPLPEAVKQFESTTVNNVVEAVTHSLREESPDIEKPVLKKRRLKRASESDKRDPGRVIKAERRRGLRDSQDTVEALNVEGSKRKTVVIEQSLIENVAMLKASQSNESCQESKSSDVTKSETKMCYDGADTSVSGGTQPFIPHLEEEEKDSPNTHYENTPPTTPEHEEGEGSTLSQQPPCASPGLDDIAVKGDKDGSSSSSSSISLPVSSNMAPAKSNSDSPSDNDMGSTTSNDNLDAALAINQSSESSGAEQEVAQSRKRKPVEEPPIVETSAKKKKRIHGTRSRTAKKSPKYSNTDSVSYQSRVSDSHTSSTPNHDPESPLSRLAMLSKSPRPSKFSFNADLGEYLEGEERCNFLITKMKEIKAIYMNLKSEVATIDRRRKRIRRKERESSQVSINDRDSVR